ncbi:hypothetical protein QT06_C0001G0362 [archaeon GW2011_AR15]|nr:hypothetical protein QT06_C0001G0362 [archaeon GW2011_AR15]
MKKTLDLINEIESQLDREVVSDAKKADSKKL